MTKINLFSSYKGKTPMQAAKAAKLRAKRYGGYVTMYQPKEVFVNSMEKPKETIFQKAARFFSSVIQNAQQKTVSEGDFAVVKMIHEGPKRTRRQTFLKAKISDLDMQSMPSVSA